jgi:GTP-binding protein
MEKGPITIHSAEFVKAAVRPEGYPEDPLPEVAFGGRSNVGKSSLINCLLNRKKLVRTSRTPGRTQTINFFLINQSFRFVDLPGYGYAKVPESVRRSWGPMVEKYLQGRTELRGVVQILDARHPPTADDLQLWGWLRERGLPAIAVLTKMDKVKRSQVQKQIALHASALGVETGEPVPFSAVTRRGRDVLWERIAPWIGCDTT